MITEKGIIGVLIYRIVSVFCICNIFWIIILWGGIASSIGRWEMGK